jgi:hypothetical protein
LCVKIFICCTHVHRSADWSTSTKSPCIPQVFCYGGIKACRWELNTEGFFPSWFQILKDFYILVLTSVYPFLM